MNPNEQAQINSSFASIMSAVSAVESGMQAINVAMANLHHLITFLTTEEIVFEPEYNDDDGFDPDGDDDDGDIPLH